MKHKIRFWVSHSGKIHRQFINAKTGMVNSESLVAICNNYDEAKNIVLPALMSVWNKDALLPSIGV